MLRRFTTADADNLAGLDADPDVMRFVNGGLPTSREEIENDFLPAFLRYYQRYQHYGFWAVIERATGDFLGWFHFRPHDGAPADQPELGYRLRKSAWGKGYATEGSRALIRKGFTEAGVQRVTAEAMAANTASRRVMEKAGLALVRTFRQSWPDAPGRDDLEVVEYALDKADWERAGWVRADAAAGDRSDHSRVNGPAPAIRRASPGDADAVADLAAGLAQSFTFSRSSFDLSYPALLDERDACLLLAADGQECLGYLLGFRHLTFYANGPVGWVEEVFVRHQARGRGTGRALMGAFEQWAAGHGCALVALATRRAGPFYRALGYEESAIYHRKVLGQALP